MAALDDSPSRCQGQSWALWAQRLGLSLPNDESEDDDEGKNKHEGDAMKLRKEDMALFGLCPAQDEFYLVVCELCGQVVKPQALKTHIELRHSNNSIAKPAGSSSNSSSSQHSHTPAKTSGRDPHHHSHQHGSFSAGSADRLGHTNKPSSCSPKHNANPLHHSKGGGGHCRSESKTTHSTAPKKPHPISTPVVRVERMSPSLVNKKANSTMGPPGAAASPAAIPVDKRELPSPQQPPPLFLPSSPTSPNLSASSPNAIAHHGQQYHHHFASPLCPPSSGSPSSQSTPPSISSPSQSLHKKAIGNATGVLISNSSISQSSESKPKPAKSKSKVPKERKLLPCKDRVYDADKHCGVFNQDSGKPCTRSLTCKTHSLALRRNVSGRRKNFDELLSDHRAAKEALIKATKAGSMLNAMSSNTHLCTSIESGDGSVMGASMLSASSAIASVTTGKTNQGSAKLNSVCMNGGSTRVSTVSTGGSNPRSQPTPLPSKSKSSSSKSNSATSSMLRPSQSLMYNIPLSTNLSQKSSGEYNLLLANCPSASLNRDDNGYISHHPRPAAVCTYNSRQMGSGFFVYDRRLDNIRAVLRMALGERFTQPPPIKKLCVESKLPPLPESSDPSDPYCFLVGEQQVPPFHDGAPASMASSVQTSLALTMTAASISSGVTSTTASPILVSASSKSSQPKTGKANRLPKSKPNKISVGSGSASTNHINKTPNSSGSIRIGVGSGPPAKRKRNSAPDVNKCNPVNNVANVSNAPKHSQPITPQLHGVSAHPGTPTGLLSMPLGINAHLTASVPHLGVSKNNVIMPLVIPNCGTTIQAGRNHATSTTANSLNDINLVVTNMEVMNGQFAHGTGSLRTSGTTCIPVASAGAIRSSVSGLGLGLTSPTLTLTAAGKITATLTPGPNRASAASASSVSSNAKEGKSASAKRAKSSSSAKTARSLNSGLHSAPTLAPAPNKWNMVNNTTVLTGLGAISNANLLSNHVALAAISSSMSSTHSGQLSSINFRPSSASPHLSSSSSPLHNGLGPSPASTPITSLHPKNLTNHILPTNTATYSASPGNHTSLSSPDSIVQSCDTVQHKGKGSRQNSSMKGSSNQKSSHPHHPSLPSIHPNTALPPVTGKASPIGLSSNSVSQVVGVASMGTMRIAGAASSATGKHSSQGCAGVASTSLPIASSSPIPFKMLSALKSQNTKTFVSPIDELRRPSQMQGSPTLPT